MDKIWLNQAPEPAGLKTIGEVSGTFRTSARGVLKLWFSQAGYLHGSFTAEDETLLLRGGFSPLTGEIQGYLLEPLGQLPVAVFSAHSNVQGLSLRMAMLGLDELLKSAGSEPLLFSKAPEKAV